MRAAACDPMPKVLCGWPRSHLLSSLLAVQRLAGRSRDPSSMACAAAAYTAPCTWPGHAGGGGGCSASKAAYALERSCSTGRGCRIKRGWRAEARGLVARGAPCWPKFGGIKQRAREGWRERARVDGRSYVHAEGSGATLQDRGQVTGTRGSHNDAALASYSPNCTF